MTANGDEPVFGLQTRPVEDGELDHLRQLGKSVPGREARHVIFADEINELRVRFADSQRFHSIDGVRGSGTLQLQGIETELRLALDGRAQHFDAEIRRGRCLVELVRRDRRGDEEQLVQLELFDRVTRQDEMRVMNGIERTAEDADLFQDEFLFRSSTRKVK